MGYLIRTFIPIRNIQYVKLIIILLIIIIFANRKFEEFQKYHSVSMDLNSMFCNRNMLTKFK